MKYLILSLVALFAFLHFANMGMLAYVNANGKHVLCGYMGAKLDVTFKTYRSNNRGNTIMGCPVLVELGR